MKGLDVTCGVSIKALIIKCPKQLTVDLKKALIYTPSLEPTGDIVLLYGVHTVANIQQPQSFIFMAEREGRFIFPSVEKAHTILTKHNTQSHLSLLATLSSIPL